MSAKAYVAIVGALLLFARAAEAQLKVRWCTNPASKWSERQIAGAKKEASDFFERNMQIEVRWSENCGGDGEKVKYTITMDAHEKPTTARRLNDNFDIRKQTVREEKRIALVDGGEITIYERNIPRGARKHEGEKILGAVAVIMISINVGELENLSIDENDFLYFRTGRIPSLTREKIEKIQERVQAMASSQPATTAQK